MSGVIVDTSVWIDFFAGHAVAALEDALAEGAVIMAPIVAAELISGAHRPRDRAALTDLLLELPLHETPLAHWIRVGELRRRLKEQGISVSTPDAHVAQCAIDRNAVLLSWDVVFKKIAQFSNLRLHAVR